MTDPTSLRAEALEVMAEAADPELWAARITDARRADPFEPARRRAVERQSAALTALLALLAERGCRIVGPDAVGRMAAELPRVVQFTYHARQTLEQCAGDMLRACPDPLAERG